MSEEGKTPRKVRSITSTFSLRDVAVVAVAAFTAAGPFFAYDTRISVIESKVEQLQKVDEEIKETVREISDEVSTHLREHRIEQAQEQHQPKEKDGRVGASRIEPTRPPTVSGFVAGPSVVSTPPAQTP